MTCSLCSGSCSPGTCSSGRLHALVDELRELAERSTVGRGWYRSGLMEAADRLEAVLPPPLDHKQYTDPKYPLLSAYIQKYMEEHQVLSADGFNAALEALLQEREPVAVRIEQRAGDYSLMQWKYWENNRKLPGYEGARVHALLLGPIVQEGRTDEEVLFLFPLEPDR